LKVSESLNNRFDKILEEMDPTQNAPKD
jgi:hypothetical protein